MAEPRPLAEDLALWLIEQRPKLLDADLPTIVEMVAALGSVLGLQMGFVLLLKPLDYPATLSTVTRKIDESAQDIVRQTKVRPFKGSA